MINCVLFDFDGTLVDSSEGVFNCVRYALESFGINDVDEATLKKFIGPPLRESFSKLFGIDGDAAVKKYRERYAETGLYESKVYDGIEEMLKKLKAKGVKLAVATLKPTEYTNRLLEHFGLAQYFDVVVGDEFDGSRSDKVEVIKEVERRLGGVDIYSTAMVGDRYYDVMAGRECGLITVGTRYGFTADYEFERSCVECAVNSVAQLADFLLEEKRPVILIK